MHPVVRFRAEAVSELNLVDENAAFEFGHGTSETLEHVHQVCDVMACLAYKRPVRVDVRRLCGVFRVCSFDLTGGRLEPLHTSLFEGVG